MRLPAEGRDWKELESEMRALKRDDLDRRRGRHAAYVWHPDDDVEEVVRQAHALFMTENGLGLRAFPSLRRMEGDVVGMVANLVGSVESVAGHMTTGGTE
jgi:glutamate/tyrosine decarboxylase-like PLP-dependent enzyme